MDNIEYLIAGVFIGVFLANLSVAIIMQTWLRYQEKKDAERQWKLMRKVAK